MATLIASRAAQYPLTATFEFEVGDDMVNVSGVSAAFTAASGTTYDVIKLPQNSVVTGGELIVETVSNDSNAAAITIGDSGSATRYLGSTSIKSAARTALVPTGYKNASALPIRITIANTDGDATTLKARVNVQYIVMNRANESQTY